MGSGGCGGCEGKGSDLGRLTEGLKIPILAVTCLVCRLVIYIRN